jgi:lysophospholipase L1-like esterase
MRADYASPDHLHPNPAGYRAMADAVDLAQIRKDPGVC